MASTVRNSLAASHWQFVSSTDGGEALLIWIILAVLIARYFIGLRSALHLTAIGINTRS